MAYLRWLKSKLTAWHERGVIDLAGSGIQSAEPLLMRHMDEHRGRFVELLGRRHDSMWGHAGMIEALRGRFGLPAGVGVLPAYGATSALQLVFAALLPGGAADRVLVETPAYDPLYRIPQTLGAGIDWLPRHRADGYRFNLRELAAGITPRTRLVVLTNLHNPTGAAIETADLVAAGEAVAGVNPTTRILVDETFAGFLGPAYRPAATLGPAFISVGGMSKVYGLSAIRAGWIFASGDTFAAIQETWLHAQNIGSRFTESLTALCFERFDEYEKHWTGLLPANRKLVADALGGLAPRLELDLPPHGCIGFPRLNHPDPDAFFERLESEYKVGVAPGRFFGAAGHFRLGFGGDNVTLKTGLDRLAQAILSA